MRFDLEPHHKESPSYNPASMLICVPRITATEFFSLYSLPERTPNYYVDAHAHYTHEFHHFMVFAGTAYGRLETMLRAYQVSVLPDIVRAISAVPPTRWTSSPQLPLARWLQTGPGIDRVLIPEQAAELHYWRAIESLLNALKGDVEIGPDEEAASSLLLGTTACPQPSIVCQRGHSHRFGARAVIEAAAEMAEYHVRMSMRPTGALWDTLQEVLVSTAGREVSVTFDGYEFSWSSASFFPAVDCLRRAPEHLIAQQLGHLSKSQRMWLLPVICDLALAAPASTDLRELVTLGERWENLHPGYRFLAILDDISRVPSNDERLADQGVYSRLVEDICDRHGWQSPNALAREVLHTAQPSRAHEHFFRKAAHLRLSQPMGFLQPFVDPQHFNVYLVLGLAPHAVFADGYRAVGPGDPNLPASIRRAGVPTEIQEELYQLMLVAAFFDPIFREPNVTCAFKAAGLNCGQRQHAHCDDCLRDPRAAICNLAAEAYRRQIGEWGFLRSTQVSV